MSLPAQQNARSDEQSHMPYYTRIQVDPNNPCLSDRINPRLLPQESAFILQKTLWQIEQLRRKGRRLRFEGLTNPQIARAGALPPTPRGNYPSEILPLISENEIAIVALRRIVDGQFHVPWTSDKQAQPAPLVAIFGGWLR